MSWCKLSSLTNAVVHATKGVGFPASRTQLIRVAQGKIIEGWEVDYFLLRALRKPRYRNMREVMMDVEDWAARQG